MKVPEDYFNSGVLLFDLEKARARLSMEEILRLLNEHEYTYCDQDVLNMLFDGRVLPLDVTWNYMTFIEEHLRSGNENSRQMFRDLGRTEPRIIHYVGSIKPWESERVLGEYYQHYQKIWRKKMRKNFITTIRKRSEETGVVKCAKRSQTGLYYNIVCNSAGQCAVDTKCICIYRDTKRCCKYVRAFNGRCGDL